MARAIASVCMYCVRSMRIYTDAHLYLQPRFPSLQFPCSAAFALSHLAVARGAEHDEPILRSRKLQTLKHQESRYSIHAWNILQCMPSGPYRRSPKSHLAIEPNTWVSMFWAKPILFASVRQGESACILLNSRRWLEPGFTRKTSVTPSHRFEFKIRVSADVSAEGVTMQGTENII